MKKSIAVRKKIVYKLDLLFFCNRRHPSVCKLYSISSPEPRALNQFQPNLTKYRATPYFKRSEIRIIENLLVSKKKNILLKNLFSKPIWQEKLLIVWKHHHI